LKFLWHLFFICQLYLNITQVKCLSRFQLLFYCLGFVILISICDKLIMFLTFLSFFLNLIRPLGWFTCFWNIHPYLPRTCYIIYFNSLFLLVLLELLLQLKDLLTAGRYQSTVRKHIRADNCGRQLASCSRSAQRARGLPRRPPA